jgi:glutamyl-tRNA synthetase
VTARTLAKSEASREGLSPVVGRLAPSPTGPLHLGHAFAFLVAWWSARAQGGRIVLRLDDLDAERASRDYIDRIVRDLEWLGLDWDGPPVVESLRLPALLAQAALLESQGLAYACVCSRGDLRRESQGAPQGGADEIRYAGTCRGRFQDRADARKMTGKEPILRFSAPPGSVSFQDGTFGEQCIDVARDVGDFPIVRRSGTPAYQLAVVVDDHLDGVTEVVRGRDLLPSTARQRLLQRALGLPEVRTRHVPLVLDGSGKRLAKRDHARSLEELRNQGVDPRQIVLWAAEAAGQLVSERMTPTDVLREFEVGRLGRIDIESPNGFDETAPQPHAHSVSHT